MVEKENGILERFLRKRKNLYKLHKKEASEREKPEFDKRSKVCIMKSENRGDESSPKH